MDGQFSNNVKISNFTSFHYVYNFKDNLTVQIIHKLFIFDFGTHLYLCVGFET